MTPFTVEFLSVPNTFPIEFRRMPLLQLPDMLASNNPQHDLAIVTAWKSPAVNGKQVCFRAGRWGADGLFHAFYTDGTTINRWLQTALNLSPFSVPEIFGSIVHDGWYGAELGPRAEGDDLLLTLWEMSGVDPKRAVTFKQFVSWFGGSVWAAHTHGPGGSVELSRQYCQLVDVGQEPGWAD